MLRVFFKTISVYFSLEKYLSGADASENYWKSAPGWLAGIIGVHGLLEQPLS